MVLTSDGGLEHVARAGEGKQFFLKKRFKRLKGKNSYHIISYTVRVRIVFYVTISLIQVPWGGTLLFARFQELKMRERNRTAEKSGEKNKFAKF